MKKIIQTVNSFILVVSACILIFSSCAKEEDNPLADDRDKFLGDWTCKETQQGLAATTFHITIDKYGSNDTITVSNFNAIGTPYKAIFLVSGTSVAIPTQVVSGFSVTNGSGTYSSSKINLSYTVDGENFTAVCTN